MTNSIMSHRPLSTWSVALTLTHCHAGFRQILVEIHGVPQPKGGNGRWYKAPMNITDYFQDFRDNGYALFNKDSNGKLAVELSFLKLDEDFYKK